MEKNSVITKDELIKEIREAGIQEGDILNLMVSLKSIGWVQGGAGTVIEAFLDVIGPNGTIVTDSFVPVKSLRYLKKHTCLSDDRTPSYAGALANAILQFPQVKRSKHPIQKFATIGKHATEFTENHTAESYAYDVLKKMCSLRAKKVRIYSPSDGVSIGTTHVAIGLLGFQQKRLKYGVHYQVGDNPKKLFLVNWAGGCSAGFNKLLPDYEKNGAVLYKGKVGQANIIVSDMKKTLEWEVAQGKKNPQFFFCDNPACVDCRLTWKFSKGNLLKVMWENIKLKKFDQAIHALIVYFRGIYQPD
ncbi:AAC(3) family N-acetyltransferase [bacterium]|nr:AAC(3) family N-acetyltransferase [bacterium]